MQSKSGLNNVQCNTRLGIWRFLFLFVLGLFFFFKFGTQIVEKALTTQQKKNHKKIFILKKELNFKERQKINKRGWSYTAKTT